MRPGEKSNIIEIIMSTANTDQTYFITFLAFLLNRKLMLEVFMNVVN